MFGFNNNRDTIRSLEKARDDAQRRAELWCEGHAKLKRSVGVLQSDLLRVEAERDALSAGYTRRSKYSSVLFDIMSQETPSANATVKRMARMAREALGHDMRPKGTMGVTDDQLIDLSTRTHLKDTKKFLAGDLSVRAAFVWENTPQGYKYWSDQNKRDEITPEARAIIEASVRRAERKS
jgi:hypothetical protein